MSDIESNKRNAIAFYELAYSGNPREAVARFAGDEYIQHNPLVADGKEAFIQYFERMHREYPEKSIEFVRAVAKDSLSVSNPHVL